MPSSSPVQPSPPTQAGDFEQQQSKFAQATTKQHRSPTQLKSTTRPPPPLGSTSKQRSLSSSGFSAGYDPQMMNNINSQNLYFPSPPTIAGKVVSDFYQWPVLFAILPPLLTVYYGGTVEEWSEGFMLVVVAFYLYGLVKIPWELYVAARVHHAHVNRVAAAYSSGQLDPMHEAEIVRQTSVWKLWSLEWLYFLLVIASPLGGAIFLSYIRPHVRVYQNLVDNFPMALYVLTAYIRPITHLTRLFKQHASALQEDVHYPNLEMDRLRRKLGSLEKRCDEMSILLTDVRQDSYRQMKETMEPSIKGLNKDLRRTARKEQKFIDYSIERFRELEVRLQEQELFLARQQHALEQRSSRSGNISHVIFAPAYWIMDTASSLTVGSLVMIPVNIGLKLVTWWIPAPVKRLVLPASYAQQPSAEQIARPSITNGSQFAPSPTYHHWDQQTRAYQTQQSFNNPPSSSVNNEHTHFSSHNNHHSNTHPRNHQETLQPSNIVFVDDAVLTQMAAAFPSKSHSNGGFHNDFKSSQSRVKEVVESPTTANEDVPASNFFQDAASDISK